MRLRLIVVLLAVMFSVNNVMCQDTAPVQKDKTFVLAIIKPENDYYGKWWRMIYTEIFRRMDIKVEFRDYPLKRATMEADAGNVDGESGRIYAYADDHPNLIRVEEALVNYNFSAFTANDAIPPLKNWDSLKGKDYKVEYQKGLRLCEIKLPKVVSKENLSDITEASRALKKLISGRTDIYVDEESGIITLMQTPEFKGSKIRLAGLMESAPLYPYLHKRHASLAPKMAEIIKTMKSEGLIEQYRAMLDKEFGVVRK